MPEFWVKLRDWWVLVAAFCLIVVGLLAISYQPQLAAPGAQIECRRGRSGPIGLVLFHRPELDHAAEGQEAEPERDR